MRVLDSPRVTALLSILGYFGAIGISYLLFDPYVTSIIIVVGSLFIYFFVALSLRRASVDAFYVAERRVPAVVNGAATAADWMSAASFLSMAGVIAVLGFDAIPFIIGWTLGYTLMAFTVAPYVRRSETFTVPEFVEARSGGWGVARLVAVVMLFIISFTYLTAQLTGIGVVFGRFLGIEAAIGAFIGVLGTVMYSWTSGWKSITWIQAMQYVFMITMYWVPVMIAAYVLGLFNPIPQVAYGPIVQEIQAREQEFGLKLWTEPFARAFAAGTGQLNWIMGALTLMLGTMGLPHILIRFYTVPSMGAARYSVGWALFFIGLLYITAPVYAAIARYSFSSLWGKPISEVMQLDWVKKWLPTGLIRINDRNGDGILQPVELTFQNDIVVVGMPDMFGMHWIVAPFVAMGGLAAAISTADGLLLSMSTAVTRDIYKRFINPRVSERGEVWMARIMLWVIAALSALLAYLALRDPTYSQYVALMVSWAFVFAASTFTPAIILGIFWGRLNRYGIVAGMIAGMAVALPYVLSVGIFGMQPIEVAGQKIGTTAWGVVGFAVNLVVSVVVSLLTKPEGESVQNFLRKIRTPEV